jgi:hypothetical protein
MQSLHARQRRIRLLQSTILLTATTLATAAAAEPAARSSPPSATDESGEVAAGETARVRLPWSEPSGTGIALAYDAGLWGSAWTQSIRARLPLHDQFGVATRGLIAFPDVGDETLIHLGARLELYGHTPVMLNVIRLYGGGGPQLFYPVDEAGDGEARWGGGGHFGFEFFISPGFSWILEIGGNGSSIEELTGATVMAGLNLYPF